MNIKNNINNFSQNLPPGCKLIAVSKTKPVEKIQEAYDAGHRRFGENKVQELVPKYEALPKDIDWHMIGHLQSNKVKYIASFVTLFIRSTALRLLEEINKQAREIGTISCLLQMHIAEEETKFGFSEEEVLQFLRSTDFKKLSNIKDPWIDGNGHLHRQSNQIRKEFKGLKTFFEKLKGIDLPFGVQMKELSMGMSGDYKIAIEEGSTLIRIGTAIFGERNTGQK